jgi:hypothetical protein
VTRPVGARLPVFGFQFSASAKATADTSVFGYRFGVIGNLASVPMANSLRQERHMSARAFALGKGG